MICWMVSWSAAAVQRTLKNSIWEKDSQKKITVLRILDSRREQFKLIYTNLSVLPYAYSILSSNKSDAYKNAVSALYDYYNATIAYKN